MTDDLALKDAEVEALGIPLNLTASEADNYDTAEQILGKLARAKSLEEIYAAETVDKFENYLGDVFAIRDFRYMPSDFPAPEGEATWPYVLINAVDSDGTERLISCGAKKVVMVLAICRREGILDKGEAVFRFSGDKTAAGNDVFSLTAP